MLTPKRLSLLVPAVVSAFAGCAKVDTLPPEDLNTLPSFVKGAIRQATYDGTSNDLLTAGLGQSGLMVAAPVFVDTNNPTANELRTRAIYNNYRALIDFSAAGGFGVLYGPRVDLSGSATLGEGKVAGDEYIAYSDDGTGRLNVTLMVQVPASFDRNNPCIVSATSSGSRGVYGAIGTAGEWGLKRGCAVAYTDKGSGNGAHDLQANTVNRQDGTRGDAGAIGAASQFTANLSAAELAAFNTASPNRFAYKHAHSQQNPERDWGLNTLQAIEFAFYVLNERFSAAGREGGRLRTIRPENTLVIASSVSNGAGAALAAAELDTQGLIDGIAVSEPQVQVTPSAALTIRRGAATVTSTGKGLMDFGTLANLYQPCAALASSVSAAPGLAFIVAARATNRCASLRAKGLVTGDTLEAQASDALSRLRAAGWEPETDVLHASHYAFATVGIAVTYANAYSRASVRDNVCGFSYGATSAAGAPTAIAGASLVQIFAAGNGIPPTGGVNVINNNSVGGPLLDGASISPTTNLQDLNVDGAICLRNLVTGTDALASAAQTGIGQVRRNANLRGKPAIIVHGRSDALEPVNHTSRPYYGLNKIAEGAASKLNYYEVTNAQHFDTFIPAVPGYDTRYVPLHGYLIQSLNLMYAHLKNGTALPPSQVVRTVPRGGTPGAAPAITAANTPAIQATPAAGDLITFSNNTLVIPD
jgi:hydroxybutyrate-dimer hydrolase